MGESRYFHYEIVVVASFHTCMFNDFITFDYLHTRYLPLHSAQLLNACLLVGEWLSIYHQKSVSLGEKNVCGGGNCESRLFQWHAAA